MTIAIEPGLSLVAAPTAETVYEGGIVATAGRARAPQWGSVAAGVIATLTTQALLDVFGIGTGILPDGAGDGMIAEGMLYRVFAYWVVTGLAALYVGGYTAGYFAGGQGRRPGFSHGLLVWCACVLLAVTALLNTTGKDMGHIEIDGLQSVRAMLRSAYRADILVPPGLAAQSGDGAAVVTPETAAAGLLLPSAPTDFDTGRARDFLASGLAQLIANDDDSTVVDRDALLRVIVKTAGVSKREALSRLIDAERELRLADDRQVDLAHENAVVSAKALLVLFACSMLGAFVAAIGGRAGAAR